MHPQDTPALPLPSTPRSDRRKIARILDFVARGRDSGLPVTELSAAEGVPRSSLYDWQARKEQIDPVNLETGQIQDAATALQRMRSAFATIDEVAQRSGLSEKRRRGIDKARRLLPRFQAHIEDVINACLDVFVRSTACVEGRNGQLALRFHSLHRLSPRRLWAMTVIHNFHIERHDGSTAAERFFGQPPEPLFEWLVANLDPPPRPRASRFRRAA